MDGMNNVADLRPLQNPPLVQSVTEDDGDDDEYEYEYEHELELELEHDEHEDKQVLSEHHHENHSAGLDPHAFLVDQVRSTVGGTGNTQDNNNHREALAYLLRYETMVRQQEAEDMAVQNHMRPCVDRLQELAGMDMNYTASIAEVLQQQVSYAQLNTALERLEQSHGLEQSQQHQQHQHNVESSDDETATVTCEFMTTDRQLMMVLRLLTKSVPATSTVTSDTDSATSTSSEEDQDNTITWAEFLQCYKTCIVGMLTLQHLPASANSQVRARTRDRTLSMLSLFAEPPTSTTFAGSNSNSNRTSHLLLLQQQEEAFDVRRPGAACLESSASSSRFFQNLNSKKKRRAIIGIIVMAAVVASTTSTYYGGSSSSPFQVDPAVVGTNNGVQSGALEIPAASNRQASSSKEASILKQQSSPSTFFSRTPLFVEKRGGVVPVQQVAAAAPLAAPQEFTTLSTPHVTLTTQSMVAPAMIGGVVGCLGAPLLVSGLQGMLKQAAAVTFTATAIGGSSTSAVTGLFPVLAGMGALLAVTSIVRGIWTVLHSLVVRVAGGH